MQVLPNRSWEQDAACTLNDAMLFELKPAAGETPPAWRRRLTSAVALCNRCPVARQCLDDALQLDDRGHIRGGRGVPSRGALLPIPVSQLRWPNGRRKDAA